MLLSDGVARSKTTSSAPLVISRTRLSLPLCSTTLIRLRWLVNSTSCSSLYSFLLPNISTATAWAWRSTKTAPHLTAPLTMASSSGEEACSSPASSLMTVWHRTSNSRNHRSSSSITTSGGKGILLDTFVVAYAIRTISFFVRVPVLSVRM